ncbi:hypothetical protein F5H01DRAFT_342047 [Linnemannia elongata]|nr:hypothetical protein F5H01DRAFT_342047 [Linnemannia elongata]
MYTTQQHWQQPQQQQPLDGCFRTATAFRLNNNERSNSSDSTSGNSSDSYSNSLSRTSSNNTSFSSDDDNCTQKRQQEKDKESLWVVDGMHFTYIDSISRARSAYEGTKSATGKRIDRRPPLSFPPSSSLTSHASTPTASVLSLSPPPSPTTPTRPPLIRIESQDLLPTRRPELWFRRSSSSNSLSSLASRRSNASRRDQQQYQKQQQHQQEQQQQQHQQRQNVVPAKPLKSILKKTRPVSPTPLTGLHLTHAHLGPLLQHQYQLQLQTQQQQQQQASSYSHDRPSLQRRASYAHHHVKQPSSAIITSPPLPPRRPRPISMPSLLNTLSPTLHPSSRPRPLPLPPRPLPTPPAAKTVHWASHNEVFVIENIEDLIEMGYFDDYDSEMGWDYRDESLDDDFSVAMDSEEDDDLGSDFDSMSARDGMDEELKSPSEDGRFEYMYRRRAIERDTSFDDDESEGGDEGEEVLKSPSEDGRFEYMYRRSADERDASFDYDEGEDVESSVAEEVESSVAEDELIHRMASDRLLGGGNGAMWTLNHHIASEEALGGVSGAMPSLLYPPLSIASRTTRPNSPTMAPPSSPLSPCFWSPPSQEQYDGVSGIIQRFQSLENMNQNNVFTRGSTSVGRSSGMISPPASPSSPQPPPRQSSLTDLSIAINKNDNSRSRSPTSSVSYLPSPSSSASTSPNLAPAVPLLRAPSALKAKCGPPRLDRAQILAEVAERKRNGVGAFASSSSKASGSRCGVDRPLSMVASASNLLRCSRGSISRGSNPTAVTVVHR